MKVNFEILVIFLVLLVYSKGLDWPSDSNKVKVGAVLNKFTGVCPGKEGIVKGQYQNVTWRYNSNGQLFVDYELMFKQDFPPDLATVWTIQKCKSREALDSCVKFTTVRSSYFCKLAADKNAAWSTFVSKCLKPKWECPYKKGVYVGKNCTVDMSLFNIFPMEGHYWRFLIELLHPSTKKLLMCFIAEGSVTKRPTN